MPATLPISERPSAGRIIRPRMADALSPQDPPLTQLLRRAAAGEAAAADAVLPIVYGELRRIAKGRMAGERSDHTLQATALVHEAYLRLLREQHVSWQNRAHFCAIAANSMRQILVERARARNAAKRGGGFHRITLDDALSPANLHAQAPGHAPVAGAQGIDIEALDDALARLALMDADQARLVELRYFGGLTIEETAEVLGVSPATVKRSWTVAKAWLKKELDAD
jgi:RNA polymerase sigma-70 factor (ECF subfamily)